MPAETNANDVLFTKDQIDQINDIRLLCCSGVPAHLRSVLMVNRTFNVSSMYVTLTVFRHRKVLRKSMQETPIFLGQMMLHGDGIHVS